MNIRLIALTITLLFAGIAQAQLYGSTREGTLFVINLSTGAGSQIGTLVAPFCTGQQEPGITEIEYDPVSKRAYAQNSNGSFNGFEYVGVTGATVGNCIVTAGSNTGIETVNGVWYATTIFDGGGASELRILDPFNGNIETLVGSTGVGPISGLAYDGNNGIMYGIAGGPSPADLYTINLATGAATVVGATSMQAGSLQFGPDGQLYAGGTGSDANLIYRINTVTAASTLVGPTGFTGSGVTGLTMIPPPVSVPTLGDLGLLLLASALTLVSLMYFRRRRLS